MNRTAAVLIPMKLTARQAYLADPLMEVISYENAIQLLLTFNIEAPDTIVVAETPKPGHVLKLLRLDAGLKQFEIAYLCGMTNGQLSRLENGSHDPQFETVLKVLHAMNMSLEHFSQKLKELQAPRENP